MDFVLWRTRPRMTTLITIRGFIQAQRTTGRPHYQRFQPGVLSRNRGGTNRTSGVSTGGRCEPGTNEKVFYRAFTLLIPASATLCARAAPCTGRDLWCWRHRGALSAVWNAVGVPDPAVIASFSGAVSSRGNTAFTITMNANGRIEILHGDPSIDLICISAQQPAGPSPSSCLLASPEMATETLRLLAGQFAPGTVSVMIDNSRTLDIVAVQHFVSSLSTAAIGSASVRCIICFWRLKARPRQD